MTMDLNALAIACHKASQIMQDDGIHARLSVTTYGYGLLSHHDPKAGERVALLNGSDLEDFIASIFALEYASQEGTMTASDATKATRFLVTLTLAYAEA